MRLTIFKNGEIGVRVLIQMGDQPVSATPAFPLSGASRLGCQFLLGRCEPDFPDFAEPHMLLGVPEIVIVLYG